MFVSDLIRGNLLQSSYSLGTALLPSLPIAVANAAMIKPMLSLMMMVLLARDQIWSPTICLKKHWHTLNRIRKEDLSFDQVSIPELLTTNVEA